ncbi:MAG: class II glutamine amidotransferase, partial [Candidatus Thermoplasmatota archaeon]|nr:class II glutamine amidotransferase [Candidatus Thermoplasmatota archaeon]
MCRFLAYHGPPVRLHELLYKPEHSLIHQSVHANERKEPLNGDGWGVGWYAPGVSEQPGLYRTLHPAWSDDNMRHVSPVVETPLFLAHVRAASPGLAVQQLNCHPFRGGRHDHRDPEELDAVERGRRRMLFMHNGVIGGYRKVIRRLHQQLSDDLFHSIQGSTDSEHAFAVIQEALGEAAAKPSLEDLSDAVRRGLTFLHDLKHQVGAGEEDTHANFLLTDGACMVATRYADESVEDPPSLYVGQAGSFF